MSKRHSFKQTRKNLKTLSAIFNYGGLVLAAILLMIGMVLGGMAFVGLLIAGLVGMIGCITVGVLFEAKANKLAEEKIYKEEHSKVNYEVKNYAENNKASVIEQVEEKPHESEKENQDNLTL